MTTPTDTARKSVIRRLAVSAAAACTLVIIVLGALVTSQQIQLQARDPLNDPQLVRLREQYAADVGNADLQRRIRELDLAHRREYFETRARISLGCRLLIAFAVALFALIGVTNTFSPRQPNLDEVCPGVTFAAAKRTRSWIAGVLSVLICVALVLYLTGRGAVR